MSVRERLSGGGWFAGRVNLIGEHIDYEGYSVLPMAIRQDMIVAIRKSDGGQVRVSNVDDKYPVCVYPADPDKVGVCSALLCPALPCSAPSGAIRRDR